MNRHSILFLLPRFSGGGAERVVLNLLSELHSNGHSVGIVIFDKSGPLLSAVLDDIPIYNLNTITLKHSIVPLIKKIRQLNPKVIFTTLGYINVAILAVRWLLPRKIKIWIREANIPSISLPNNPKPRVMSSLYRLLYARADKLICTSIKMKDEFILDFSVSKDKIKILPNIVDVETIQSFTLPARRFDNGGVCYVASGRLTFQKGFDRLLCWFSELNDEKSTLTILGDGDLKYELINKVELLNLQGQVKFLGFCDNPWQWYAGADVFLLSSRWEGMPNSVLEALVCGTPVIATEKSGGIKEIVSNNIAIADNSKQFIDFMKKSNIKSQSAGLNCLLPEAYKKENVMFIFEEWLNEVK
jgi:glycosyltransferase involved in cell wall biosynthesis